MFVTAYHVRLHTPGSPTAQFLLFESGGAAGGGLAIFVNGQWAGVREAMETAGASVLLDCRRFYRVALVDEAGENLGDYFHEEPVMAAGDRFMPDERKGSVLRMVAFDAQAAYGFDGVLVVEPFVD